ncbi:MAG: hypothetical protein QM781_09690 [Chitinophagaceae bacterium]
MQENSEQLPPEERNLNPDEASNCPSEKSLKVLFIDDEYWEGLSPGSCEGFIHRVMEFERQYALKKYIKVGKRLGHPVHFKPVSEIPENEMDQAWDELHNYMRQHGISLSACSPSVSSRDLYRFALGEMLDLDVSDIDIPDLIHCFVYDEFFPDPVYEATQTACHFAVKALLENQPINIPFHFWEDNLRLNQYAGLTRDELKNIVNRFKRYYTDLIPNEIVCTDCQIMHPFCYTEGFYSILASLNGKTWLTKANWRVLLEFDTTNGYWNIREVEIDELEF